MINIFFCYAGNPRSLLNVCLNDSIFLSSILQPATRPQCTVSFIRPPGTVVPDGLMFYPWCIFFRSFFFSPRVLRASSTDLYETLPHDQNLAVFYNPTPKIWGPYPKKIWEPKTCKISVNFGPLQTLIANISGTAQDIQNWKASVSRSIPPAFNEKDPVNFGPLITEI